jgi:hypothetical protein
MSQAVVSSDEFEGSNQRLEHL